MRRTLFLLVLLIFSPLVSAAAPAPDRFAAMDANGDSRVSREEFNAALPGLSPAAFDAIDGNRDGRISRAEWEAFSKNHGMRMGSGAPAEVPAPGALPLLTPPAAKQSPPADLPLLNPPASGQNLPLLEPPRP